mgnify:FL=1|jgi:hypothetical protein
MFEEEEIRDHKCTTRTKAGLSVGYNLVGLPFEYLHDKTLGCQACGQLATRRELLVACRASSQSGTKGYLQSLGTVSELLAFDRPNVAPRHVLKFT